jgi:hypothetical protein
VIVKLKHEIMGRWKKFSGSDGVQGVGVELPAEDIT